MYDEKNKFTKSFRPLKSYHHSEECEKGIFRSLANRTRLSDIQSEIQSSFQLKVLLSCIKNRP